MPHKIMLEVYNKQKSTTTVWTLVYYIKHYSTKYVLSHRYICPENAVLLFRYAEYIQVHCRLDSFFLETHNMNHGHNAYNGGV